MHGESYIPVFLELSLTLSSFTLKRKLKVERELLSASERYENRKIG